MHMLALSLHAVHEDEIAHRPSDRLLDACFEHRLAVVQQGHVWCEGRAACEPDAPHGRGQSLPQRRQLGKPKSAAQNERAAIRAFESRDAIERHLEGGARTVEPASIAA